MLFCQMYVEMTKKWSAILICDVGRNESKNKDRNNTLVLYINFDKKTRETLSKTNDFTGIS